MRLSTRKTPAQYTLHRSATVIKLKLPTGLRDLSLKSGTPLRPTTLRRLGYGEQISLYYMLLTWPNTLHNTRTFRRDTLTLQILGKYTVKCTPIRDALPTIEPNLPLTHSVGPLIPTSTLLSKVSPSTQPFSNNHRAPRSLSR